METTVFPLPLAPFEEYMLVDDRPTHPMQFFYRLRFSGHLDQTKLTAAFETSLARHPFLRAIVRAKGRHWEWVDAPDCSPQLTWFEQEPTDRLPGATFLDLRTQAGLCATVVQGKETGDIVCHFHHSCCDGAGAGQFARDLLVAYANSQSRPEDRIRLEPLDDRLLDRRATFGLTGGDLLKMARKQAVGLAGVRQFFMRSPRPILPHRPSLDDVSLPADYPSHRVHRFDVGDTESIRTTAMRLRVAMNDLLLGRLFLALGDWRQRHDFGSKRDWLRLSVPMSMRQPSDSKMPAANVVSMVFLDRRPEDCDKPTALLESIHDEMNLIKRNQLGLTFILSLRLLRRIPGGLGSATSARKCSASALVTNLGEVLADSPLPRREGRIVAGDVVLESVEVGAPNRPYQCAAFLFWTYAGRLAVCLQYDSRVLDAGLAEDLLDTYVDCVRS